MPNTPNNQPTEPHAKGEAPQPIALPSTLRFDLLILTLTAFAGLLGGIVITLTILGLGSPDLLLLLGILCALGAISVFFLRARARQLQQTALSEWTRAERATQTAVLNEQALQLRTQRAQIETLESNLAFAEQHDAATGIPVIRGWQALGMPEEEIAPQLQILAALFHGQAEIYIQKRFDGGHRNRGVYQIRSTAEADRIVKLARSCDIRAEREAQEWINRFSQNNGAQYVRDVHSNDDAEPGGIVYRLPSLRRNAVLASLKHSIEPPTRPVPARKLSNSSTVRHCRTVNFVSRKPLPCFTNTRCPNAFCCASRTRCHSSPRWHISHARTRLQLSCLATGRKRCAIRCIGQSR